MLEIDRVTAEVVEAFRVAGIRSILLKGPALARWLFDRGSERSYVDCDLLVPVRSVDVAGEVLALLGFRRSPLNLSGDWPRHALVFSRDGVSVDLHRSLVGVGVSPDELWSTLSGDTTFLHVGGSDVEVLSPTARALLVALHAAKDGARVEKVNGDLRRAVERVPREAWIDVASLADRLSASEALAAGLRRVPAGARLAAELGLPTGVTAEIAMRERRVPPLATGINWLITSKGMRGKVGLVGRKLFPPVDFMRAWSRLAQRGVPGLLAAYAWRLIWVAWHGIPAVRSVVRAHRRARRAG